MYLCNIYIMVFLNMPDVLERSYHITGCSIRSVVFEVLAIRLQNWQDTRILGVFPQFIRTENRRQWLSSEVILSGFRILAFAAITAAQYDVSIFRRVCQASVTQLTVSFCRQRTGAVLSSLARSSLHTTHIDRSGTCIKRPSSSERRLFVKRRWSINAGSTEPLD